MEQSKVTALISALKAALAKLEEERAAIIECGTISAEDGTPDLETMDTLTSECVAEFDSVIQQGGAALSGAEPEVCPGCDGTGWENEDDMEECCCCWGTGRLEP